MITVPKTRGATKKPKAMRLTGKRMAGGPMAEGLTSSAENKTGATTTLSNLEHGRFVTKVIMHRVTDMGLITDPTVQVGARLPTGLLERAKERTGLTSNTDLLIFALANLAVEDDFADAFARARGMVDADLEF